MALGGWESQETVLAHQATDLDAMRSVLARRQPTHLPTHPADAAPREGCANALQECSLRTFWTGGRAAEGTRLESGAARHETVT